MCVLQGKNIDVGTPALYAFPIKFVFRDILKYMTKDLIVSLHIPCHMTKDLIVLSHIVNHMTKDLMSWLHTPKHTTKDMIFFDTHAQSQNQRPDFVVTHIQQHDQRPNFVAAHTLLYHDHMTKDLDVLCNKIHCRTKEVNVI